MRAETSDLGRSPTERADPNVQDVPWVLEGILAGAIGAAAVALFFLLLDLVQGRPLWTPFALGSRLFLDTLPAPDASVRPVLVAAYTVLHGGVFVAVGLLASFELMTGTRLPGARAWQGRLLLTGLLFLALGVIFLAFALLGAPGVTALLGLGPIALANLLAAAAMALALNRLAERRGLRGRGPA